MSSKTERPIKERTLGDGMDNSLVYLENQLKPGKNFALNITPSSAMIASFKPVEPKTRVINLVPKYVPKEKKALKLPMEKCREPKFIPYEPYKGAINPIIPHKSEKSGATLKIVDNSSKTDVDIQELTSQISDIRVSELRRDVTEIKGEEKAVSFKQWEAEKLAYVNDIKNLRESNSHLENQLKFQAQVNSELKTLLVAAVGEDLESRVQHLTEDKLQLARALLKSANHLTSHQEQTEWLSGQCEVWRSKFLASSLMVEELARWKSALTSRINDLQETVKGLLDEHTKAQKKSVKTYCYLKTTFKKISSSNDKSQLKNLSIVELANANFSLSRQISEITSAKQDDCDILLEEITKLPQGSVCEKNGHKLLQNPVVISTKQDAICNALMGTAMALNGEQMYLQYPSSHATCCSHCTGEIKNI